MAGKLRITLKRSTIGRPPNQRENVRTLGLRKLHHSVVHPDTPDIRGKVRKVAHLVEVEELADDE